MRCAARKWLHALPWILLICLLAGFATFFCASRLDQPMYRAVYKLFAVPSNGEVSIRALARGCRELTQTDDFQNSVLRHTNSDGLSYVDVRDVADSYILEVSARGPDAQIVQGLANGVGKALLENVPNLFALQSAGEIAQAQLPEAPFGLPAVQKAALAAAVGFVALTLLWLIVGASRRYVCFDSPSAKAFALCSIADTRSYAAKGKARGTLLERVSPIVRETIRQMVLVLRADQRKRCFVLSGVHKDALSAQTTALAASELAQQGFRVLLMQMNPQPSRMGEWLGVLPTVGLEEYLLGRASLDAVIVRAPIGNLSYAEWLSPNISVADVVAADLFVAFVDEAKHHFDFVLLHAAPCRSAADAPMLGLVADGSLLFCCDGKQTLPAIENAAQAFARMGRPAKGVIFTGVPAKRIAMEKKRP